MRVWRAWRVWVSRRARRWYTRSYAVMTSTAGTAPAAVAAPTLGDLPSELVVCIAAYLGIRDLRAVALSSRALRATITQASAAIWRQVSTSEPLPSEGRLALVQLSRLRATADRACVSELRRMLVPPGELPLRGCLSLLRSTVILEEHHATPALHAYIDDVLSELAVEPKLLSNRQRLTWVRDHFILAFLGPMTMPPQTTHELLHRARLFLGYFLVKDYDDEQLRSRLRRWEKEDQIESHTGRCAPQSFGEAMHEGARVVYALLCAVISMGGCAADDVHLRQALGLARVSVQEHGVIFQLPTMLPERDVNEYLIRRDMERMRYCEPMRSSEPMPVEEDKIQYGVNGRWRIIEVDKAACTARLQKYDADDDDEEESDLTATFQPETMRAMRTGPIMTANLSLFTSGKWRVTEMGYVWPTWYAD